MLAKLKKEINSNIEKLIQFNKSDNELYKTKCFYSNENKHNMFYDPVEKKFFCLHCGFKDLDLVELTAKKINKTELEVAQYLLRNRLNKDTSNILSEIVNENNKKKILYNINEDALKIYREYLDKNQEAKEYLYNKRGLTNQTINDFELGYAPIGNIITNTLSNKYDLKDLVHAGIVSVSKTTKKPYDVFSGRIMFPIRDEFNNLVAFGGRILKDENKTYANGKKIPKYLNTRTTAIFNKSETLYNENNFRKNPSNETFICEGYLDVIAMHQNGITNVVAPLGVALTKQHYKKLLKYTKVVVNLFDGDDAGIKAAKKSIRNGKSSTVILPKKPLTEEELLNIKVCKTSAAKLKDLKLETKGLDPDEFLKLYGKDIFLKYVSHTVLNWMSLSIKTYKDFKDKQPNIIEYFLQIDEEISKNF